MVGRSLFNHGERVVLLLHVFGTKGLRRLLGERLEVRCALALGFVVGSLTTAELRVAEVRIEARALALKLATEGVLRVDTLLRLGLQERALALGLLQGGLLAPEELAELLLGIYFRAVDDQELLVWEHKEADVVSLTLLLLLA